MQHQTTRLQGMWQRDEMIMMMQDLYQCEKARLKLKEEERAEIHQYSNVLQTGETAPGNVLHLPTELGSFTN